MLVWGIRPEIALDTDASMPPLRLCGRPRCQRGNQHLAGPDGAFAEYCMSTKRDAAGVHPPQSVTTSFAAIGQQAPPVRDPVGAMHSAAPTLHPQMASYQGLREPVAMVNNVFAHNSWSKGDIAEGFSAADRIFEHTFSVQLMHQGYIEPHACVVHIDENGRAQVWANNKGPFMLREQLAAVCDMSK